jgi:Chitobiase/beta-hexosaminidase C-terminal domain/Bacterial Ig-like domain (group 2)
VKKMLAVLALSVSVPTLATTYTVKAGSNAGAIQAIVNIAGSGSGNTVLFSAGSYSLAATVTLPCSNGTLYTGANVGVVSQRNLPTAVLTSTVTTNYALSTDSNGTSLTGSQGCMIEYLRFSGTQGGILVYYPASGITIQQNAFDNNDPPAGGGGSQANIYLGGQNSGFTAATGVQHISVVWNTFFNNCAAIRAVAYPDSGGACTATWVNGYNNYLVWSNNTINLTEEGLKLSEQSSLGISSLNADVENNNMQGNSRILIETQQDTNGIGNYSHNAFYQPYNPGFNTFELSAPEFTSSVSPTHVVTDDVFIGNVPITLTGQGGHYGIGLELWGAGSVATYNVFQGGNGPDTCAAGWGCSGWDISVGEPFTNANIRNNYFSGTDVWGKSASDVSKAVTYEDNASSSNAGLVLSPNTVVQTSTTIATVAPAISAASSSTGATITLSDSDTNHALSFFYTTDGSAPRTFPPGGAAGTSRVYGGPFQVAAGTTVKTIASWGRGANQGIVFPSFGYVPSSVTTLLVAAQGRTLLSAYLHATGNTMVKGGTLQFSAYGAYSDGSVSLLPDTEGNAVTAWNTSNHALAQVSSGGHVTAVGTGTVNVGAVVGDLQASVWTVKISAPTVTPPPTPVVPTAPNPEPPAPASVPAGPVPAAPGPAQPDGFAGPFWRLQTPVGGSASISNSHLFLGVPGGANHDPLQPSNQAVRVVQEIGNQDFDVSIKIDSPLFAADADTSQGLMMLADNEDFVTFALTTDGNNIGLSVHTVIRGVATTQLEDTDFSQYQNPMYLRLSRTGSAYVAQHSADGVSWAQAASFTYLARLTAIGPYASNYNENPAKAVPVVMSVNWFDVQQ